MKQLFWVALILLPFLVNPVRAEIHWYGSAGLSSDYVIRGLSQTNKNPSLQLSTGVEHSPSGVYAGVWLANIDTSELLPDLGEQQGYEFDYMIGVSRFINRDWRWDVNIGHYAYGSDQRMLDYDYSEASFSVDYQQRYRASVIYSPEATDHTRQNTLLQGSRIAYEMSGEWAFSENLAVNGGLGYADLSQVSDVKHKYWSVGIAYSFSRYSFNLALYGTDARARERFIDGRADNRWVLSVATMLGG